MTLQEHYIKDITIMAARLLGEVRPSYDLSADAAFIVAAIILASARLPLDTEIPDER